jgi:tetratricopeptide (TPR) repeat protein
MKLRHVAAVLLCVVLGATAGFAQSALLDLPRDSQHAVLTQRVGVTDITINYHRPLVKGRKIFGSIVPYGQVWRAGANENTTITFTDSVTIEGQPLAAGTYGLHMIPNENEWTVIFSKMANAWGSFSYDQKEDALRVNVKPQGTAFHEALTYEFDQPTADSAVAMLSWDKVAVPFKIAVNVHEAVERSLQKQMRGIAQYTWDGWDDAANYWINEKTNYEEALKDSDQSIAVERRFENLMTKSKALEGLGKKTEAASLREEALGLGNSQQLYGYGRQLQRDKQQEQAFAVYRAAYKKYPNDWLSHAGMARIYCSQSDFDNAVKEMKLAQDGAPEPAKVQVGGLVKRLQAKEDINK